MYDKVGGGVSDTSHIPFPFSSSSHRYLLGGATAQRAPTGSKEYKCQQNLEGEGASLFRGPQLFLLFVYLTSTPLLSELASLHSHSLSTISWSSLFSRNRVHSTLKYTHFSTEHPPPQATNTLLPERIRFTQQNTNRLFFILKPLHNP